MGSDPGDNTNIIGAVLLESLNDFARSNGGGSMYRFPNFAVTNSCTAGTIYSKKINMYKRFLK